MGAGVVFGAEAGKWLMTTRLQSTQPLAARLILALPRQFPRRTDAPAVSVQPQANQQSRVGVLTPSDSFDSGNLLMIAAQVQAPGQFPDRSDAGVFVHQLLNIHTSKNKLLAINRNQARNCGRLVRHERSLPTPHHQPSAISPHVPVPGSSISLNFVRTEQEIVRISEESTHTLRINLRTPRADLKDQRYREECGEKRKS